MDTFRSDGEQGHAKSRFIREPFMASGIAHDRQKSNDLSLKEWNLHGFVPIKLDKLTGLGVLSPYRLYQMLCNIEDVIGIKVHEKTADLGEARKELDSLGYSISHDLKGPLRVINGYCHLLKVGNTLSESETREMIESISQSAVKMTRLIDDLMRLSRINSDEILKHTTDMLSLVRSVILQIEQDTLVRVPVILKPLPDASCDSGLVRQVWVNLICNALKYSGKNARPRIWIGAKRIGGEIAYYVKDNGCGFDMRFASKLFMPFQRLHSAVDFEGTGVGLAIASKIVHRHGGRIWAQAEEGKGAQFFFTL